MTVYMTPSFKDPDFPFQVMLTENYTVVGYVHRKGSIFKVTGYDKEMDAYLVGRNMIARNVTVIATPEMIEAFEREEAAKKAERQRKRQQYEESRRVAEIDLRTAPYKDNPLYGMF